MERKSAAVMAKIMTKIYRVVFRAIDVLYFRFQNRKKMCDRYDLTIERNACYNKDFPKECLLDTYVRREEGKKYPVFIYIHGGGFVAGSKDYRIAQATTLAKMGAYVFNINHGFCPKYTLPEVLRQLVSALNFIYDNAERYSLDLDRVLISGDSSGAYLSSMLIAATLSEELRAACKVEPKLQIGAAVLICGLYDLETALKKPPFHLGYGLLRDITGHRKIKDFHNYELRNLCNSMNFVGEGFPPTFISAAKFDVLCKGQGEAFLKKLNEKGVYNESHVARSIFANHCYSLTWKSRNARINNEKTKAFIEKFLNGKFDKKPELADALPADAPSAFLVGDEPQGL